MAILSVSENDFKKLIAENFTPSEEIRTPERLFGREKNMRVIERAMNSAGRQIFIYGDRGVGKTSLARTAAYVHTGSASSPIYVPCGNNTTFAAAIQSIGSHTIDIKDRIERPAVGRGFNINLTAIDGLGVTAGTPGSATIPAPQTIDDALDIVRYVGRKHQGRVIVVLDEMERIESKLERDLFAEFIKNISTLDVDIRFIFCGIASDVDELLNSHPSAGRILEPIPLEQLNHNYLWQIITTVSEKLGITISREMLIRIGQISDGFPHFVHLIGDTLFWNINDDPEEVTVTNDNHFHAGIKGAAGKKRSDATKTVQKSYSENEKHR